MKDTPAFPHTIEHLHEPQTTGMTLRDYFAAKAMEGLLAHGWCSDTRDHPYGADVGNSTVAIDAYLMADAMLKARTE